MALPLSVTALPSFTAWFAPAFTVGASLMCLTVTLVVALLLAPTLSVTVSWKVNTISTAATGAVKVAVAALALVSTTVGPTPVRVQR